MKQDQAVLQKLLKFRASGYSLAAILRSAAPMYVLHIVLLALVLFGAVRLPSAFARQCCVLTAGMLIGALLRDVGWLRKGRRQWPLMLRIIDWAKIEALASGPGVPPSSGAPRIGKTLSACAGLLLLSALLASAAESADPFLPYLDGKAPEIVREVPSTNAVPENITVRRVVFRSRDNSEIFAVIATPKASGKHPGMLVLHGGGGSAEEAKAMAWAQRGYVAVAPDLPGIAEPKKLTESRGRWSSLKYGDGRWVATPDAGASVIFDAVLSAMKSLYLLRAQPGVDPSRIGVVGISWGGYMTTMVCGLAGDDVRAGLAVWGCGFYDLTAQLNGPASTLGRMPEDERERWLRHLDAGRRAPGIKAAFFIAGAANDFFYWPRAVQATLDAIPGEKNHFYAPNANHKAPLPGGSVVAKTPAGPFKPTPFQPFPTPGGDRGNWLAMEVPFFEYHLKGLGQPLPKVRVVKSGDPHLARFGIVAPRPLTKVEVYWARTNPDVMKREWLALPATTTGDDHYEAKLPADAADWFALVSDDRPLTVSGDLTHIDAPPR